ncbi:phage tail protein, partial [Clostridium botulinum]|nr:phage tail protein [Clostridium botulinum]
MRKTLMWNGIRAEDMGVKIISLPPISLSTQRVNEVEIEGRDGFLTELDGYGGDTKQVEADYRGNNPQKLLKWLRGSGEVIFGNVDDRYYKARISNIVPLEQIIENQLYN